MAMDSLEREARERKKRMLALATLPLSVGFFVWRLQARTEAAPDPDPAPPPVVQKAAPAVQQAAGAVMALEKQRVVVVPMGERDPFTPQMMTRSVNPVATVQTPKPEISEMKPETIKLLPSLPPLKPFGPLRPLEPAVPHPAPGPIIEPAPVAPPPAVVFTKPVMPYVLTGIVKGNPDVAILRHTDGSRRLARQGDMLDKDYRLTAIEETAVQVTGNGEMKMLRLGGHPPIAKPLAETEQ